MDTDRNLLFGVLALQADLIDTTQFIEACLLWTRRKDVPLADLLVERGWIMSDDKAHLDYLLGRKLHKHGGDPRASLAAIPDHVKRSLAALENDDIRRSLAPLPGPEEAARQLATVDHVPEEQRLFHILGGHGQDRLRQLGLGPALAHASSVTEVPAGVGFQRPNPRRIVGGDQTEPIQPEPPAVRQHVGQLDVQDAGPAPVPLPPGRRVETPWLVLTSNWHWVEEGAGKHPLRVVARGAGKPAGDQPLLHGRVPPAAERGPWPCWP